MKRGEGKGEDENERNDAMVIRVDSTRFAVHVYEYEDHWHSGMHCFVRRAVAQYQAMFG